MYAIRSYYESLRHVRPRQGGEFQPPGFVDIGVDRRLGNAEVDVITSYSIHYTKLYEVTPHLGANTFEAQKNVAVDVSREIINYIDGRPLENAVNIPRFDPDLMDHMKPFLGLVSQMGEFIAQLAPANPGKVVFTS